VLRIIVVLPLYLALTAIAPRLPFYAALVETMAAIDQGLIWHIGGYAIALVLSGIAAWFIEYRLLPFSDRYTGVLAVLRMGFIGVLVASGFQLFMFFTGQPLSVFILFMPIIFMIAEAVYEFVEAMLERGRIRRARQIDRI